MRNAVIGIVLALVLIAGLFAAAHYGNHPTQQSADEPSLDPAQASAQINEGYIGDTKIGDWKLSCGPGRELPKAPPLNGHTSGNSEGTPPKEEPPPPGWKIPRCRVFIGLKNPHDPEGDIRITFRQTGFKRVLTLFMRLPPSEIDAGDSVTLRLDKAVRPISVRTCARIFCLVIESIRKPDMPSFLSAQKMILEFTARNSGQHIAVSIPTNGMAAAIAAMRRADR